ncbi:SusD-like starch-binding protein associating with outer membrane [Chryseobacterium sp. 52]|uniref:SusD/RagB family nutrient-binding outer membrane lipoprotein n=1 Tax=Chryseobacterium sp. 52 TaxID=2035213 RepID=UPI000C187AAC|nr:SusD/RagB family nutrient-binding outer membrane lipoprotein [Chryseobacterium sp. 52]PIF47436.1 SusD-like starch-binding protein associating with outer membrane [Chryseobacterium sp. 52]
MKKLNKIKLILPLAALSLSVLSCNDYLDINESPNAGHIENVTPAQVLPGALNELYRTQGSQVTGPTSMMTFGNVMMNSWATNVHNFGGVYGAEYTLSGVNNTFYTGIWDRIYLYTANFKLIEDYNNADHSQDNYVAIAKIMKAFYLQYIVDLYGDAPYKEAFLRSANTTPKYDDDKEIYKALIGELETANAIIDAENPNAIAASTDPIFKGAMASWRAFSNTVKLRMLLRMSNVTGDMATYRDQKLATLSGETFINQEVLINPGYSSANNDRMNPFVSSYRATATGSSTQIFQRTTASEHIANCLNGNLMGGTETYYTKFNGITDPRRFRLFSSVTYQGVAQVKGIRQGANSGDPGAPTDNKTLSALGTGNFAGSTAVATVAELVAAGNTRGGVIMSLAESKFLQSEAALRYPSLFSGGDTNFQQAIVASGIWLGVPASGSLTPTQVMQAYVTSVSTRPGLGWTGSNTQKLEAIMTQKWLALTNVNPAEMYIEYNRTGFPVTPLATTSTRPNRPYRLFYPVSEYTANSANVPNVTADQMFTKNATTPFWNQN